MSDAVLQEKPHVSYFAKSLPSAKLAGIKSGHSRRQAALKAKAFDSLSLQLVPHVQHSAELANSRTDNLVQVLDRLSSHMAKLDDLMDKATDPGDWRDLTMARSKLFEQWAHLAGIPKPMAGREPRQSQRRVSLTPIDIDLPQVPKLPAEPTPTKPEPLHRLPGDVTP